MNPSVSDRELIDAVVAGHRAAAADFVEWFAPFILAVAGRYARRGSTAIEAIPQNVIEALWEDDFRRLRMWRGSGD